MAKVTSDDCKKWIVQNLCPTSETKDWKRRSKHKDGNEVIRTFENVEVGILLEVVECNGAIIRGRKAGSSKTEECSEEKIAPTGSLLATLKMNPIKVSFLPIPPCEYDDLSGRMIYDIGEEGLDDVEALEEEGGIGFYCGPETKGGWLHDTADGGCTEKLEELFADLPTQTICGSQYPGISLHDAENYHTIALIPGVSPQDLWALIVERLERSGAVRMKPIESRLR